MYEGPSVAASLEDLDRHAVSAAVKVASLTGGSGVSLVQRRSTPLCQFNRGSLIVKGGDFIHVAHLLQASRLSVCIKHALWKK
jgi:hypothetical protein